MSNPQLTDTFFTDAPLVPHAAGVMDNPVSHPTSAAIGPGVRHFCGGHHPAVYPEPGPLAWDE